MDQEWIGVEGKCDVVVSLVQRSTSTSTDQGLAAMAEKEGRKRKRLSKPGDEDETVGYLHVCSNRLRLCSKYFDTCLSKEWAGADIKTPVHLSLEVHTGVKYYRECFSRMHSCKCNRIPNVEHGLKLLQVASQMSYFRLVEDCVRYLASIPWSQEEETRIREFASSTLYPSDCAADLSARLGFPSSNTERHRQLCNITESAICQHFEYAMREDDLVTYDRHGKLISSRKLFSVLFRKIIAGPYETLVENVLKHVHAYVKKIILGAMEDPGSNDDPGFGNVRWILGLLLKTGFATESVEYIAKESPLREILKEACTESKLSWVYTIYDVFQEVIAGHVLLNTSTRYMLLQNWMWMLELGASSEDNDFRAKIPVMLNTIVLTFPIETQKELFSDWLMYYESDSREVYYLNYVELRANWIKKLLKKISSLEPL